MESTTRVPVPDPPPPPAHCTGRRGLGSRYRGGRGSRYRGGRRYHCGCGTPPLPRNSGSGLSRAGDEGGLDQGGVDQGRADQEQLRGRERGKGGRGGRPAKGGAGRGRVHHNGARGRGFRGQRRGGPRKVRDRRPYAYFIRDEGGADNILLDY